MHLTLLRISGWCGQKCTPALPFLSTPRSGFCAKAVGARWLNRAVTHTADSLGWMFTGTGLRVHESTVAGKTTLGKNWTLPKQGAQTHSALLKIQTLLFRLSLFNCTALTVSIAIAGAYSSYFYFIYASCSWVTFPSFHSFSLQ